jgi:hypothetical protein
MRPVNYEQKMQSLTDQLQSIRSRGSYINKSQNNIYSTTGGGGAEKKVKFVLPEI